MSERIRKSRLSRKRSRSAALEWAQNGSSDLLLELRETREIGSLEHRGGIEAADDKEPADEEGYQSDSYPRQAMPKESAEEST
ncbi:hypothetical protein ABZW96_36970 [Nocardia sp. NPDC004168]|uniref:hypothetical protein n=1 Tax=Nocardia sp. NPDC004168 TaxID=3154452 RepID=UPI0033B24D13